MSDEQGVAPPQLTFTEEDHGDMVKFLNMMNEAKFDGFNLKKAHEAATLHVKAIKVVKKIEDHILEIKRVIDNGRNA